jgi:hydrogenase maturation protein HypF
MSTITAINRHRWVLNGQVQGVGFRPFVYRLASQLDLQGFVRNDLAGVTIEAQGSADAIELFDTALVKHRPALSSFRVMSSREIRPVLHEVGFHIQPSQTGSDQSATAQVTIDAAVCDDCLCEMHDPADRRHRYGLINCTNCGPRYSIIEHIPYDRPNTTMAGFAMCSPCAVEYADPADRRFHAQPTACCACGPVVSLVDSLGSLVESDPYIEAAQRLRDGQVLAIKGLGGFHLAARADDD